MADERVVEARLIVSKRIISNALDSGYAVAPEHENYPDIGEHDWTAIVLLLDIHREHLDPDIDAYEAAYNFLDARADAE